MNAGWLARRAAAALAMLAALSVIAFALVSFAPGDLASEAQADPRLSAETVARLRESFGLDRPFVERLAGWLGRLLRGDLGNSIAYNLPVSGLLAERLSNTVLLAMPALVLAWSVSFAAAMWAKGRGGWVQRSGDWVASAVLAIPEPVAAAAMVLIALRTGWLPAAGMHDARGGGGLADLARHAVLPVVTLALWAAAPLYFHVRNALAEAAAQPFIDSAVARGIGGMRLTAGYELLAAAPRLIPLVGLSAGSMLSGAVVAESVFGWPGLGSLLVNAVAIRDFPVVLGAVLLAAGFRLAANFAADVALFAADPRIRVR